VPVSLYVGSESADAAELVDAFRVEVARVLGIHGFAVQPEEWGPFWGSAFITIFGRGEREELGGEFRDHLADMTRDLHKWVKTLPPSLKLVVIIGSAVVAASGTASGLTPMALTIVALAPNTESVLNEIERLIRGKTLPPDGSFSL
jgi:hypothetical protein